MQYEKTVKLPRNEIYAIESLLTPPKNEYMVIPNCPKEVFRCKFSNKRTVVIFIDVPAYSPKSDNKPWLYAELFTEDGVSIQQSPTHDELIGEWEIIENTDDSNDVYNILITA